MASDLASISTGWLELESDPGLFTLLLQDFGVKNVEVKEVYDLDNLVDGNVFGFVFLFKWGSSGRRARRLKAENPRAIEVSDESTVKNMFFAHQIIPNSCATHALISILMNSAGEDCLGNALLELKQSCINAPPETKGYAIGNVARIAAAHNRHACPTTVRESYTEQKNASSGASTTSSTSSSSGGQLEAFHFASFVPINGRLYELDGLKSFPLDHGEIPDGLHWTEVFREVIAERINQTRLLGESEEIRYNLMAVVPNEQKRLESELKLLEDKCKVLMDSLAQLIQILSPGTLEKVRSAADDIKRDSSSSSDEMEWKHLQQTVLSTLPPGGQFSSQAGLGQIIVGGGPTNIPGNGDPPANWTLLDKSMIEHLNSSDNFSGFSPSSLVGLGQNPGANSATSSASSSMGPINVCPEEMSSGTESQQSKIDQDNSKTGDRDRDTIISGIMEKFGNSQFPTTSQPSPASGSSNSGICGTTQPTGTVEDSRLTGVGGQIPVSAEHNTAPSVEKLTLNDRCNEVERTKDGGVLVTDKALNRKPDGINNSNRDGTSDCGTLDRGAGHHNGPVNRMVDSEIMANPLLKMEETSNFSSGTTSLELTAAGTTGFPQLKQIDDGNAGVTNDLQSMIQDVPITSASVSSSTSDQAMEIGDDKGEKGLKRPEGPEGLYGCLSGADQSCSEGASRYGIGGADGSAVQDAGVRFVSKCSKRVWKDHSVLDIRVQIEAIKKLIAEKHVLLNEETRKHKQYKIDDCRRTHDYDHFIHKFVWKMIEKGKYQLPPEVTTPPPTKHRRKTKH